MNTPGKLTLEQEFELQLLKQQIETLPLEQTRAYLLEAVRQLMLKDNWVKYTFRECYLRL
ncbi:MAG: phycobilisome degradation protein nblA [Leptolyngbya sp. SIO4C1]|nr:phycobilisome degradation protein nblA [Leptolyngbya sp. SIO4C1]